MSKNNILVLKFFLIIYLKNVVNNDTKITNIPLKINKIATAFLLLIYNEYPFNIFEIPNKSNAIGKAIFMLMILNKPKEDNIITITEINIVKTLICFKLSPPKTIFSLLY